MDERCFHCGAPVDGEARIEAEIEGRSRSFCCVGCRAVCEAIFHAGQGDYYRIREQPGRRPGTGDVGAQRFAWYDRPEFQQRLVREGPGWREVVLALEEIRCAACLWLNERHLRQLQGVIEADVDFVTHRARVRWDPGRTGLGAILAAVEAIGYRAHPLEPGRVGALEVVRRRRGLERILFAGLIGMPVMQVALAGYLMGAPGADGTLPLWVRIGRWSSLVATAAILAYSGQEFFANAWRDLRRRRLGMDVPVALGLLVAWLGSAYATVRGTGEVYYDSIAMFVLLVLLARRMELGARLRVAHGLDRLSRIVPRAAHRLDPTGVERDVPVAELRPGDLIRIGAGERIPADGVVERGNGAVDESVLTGEVHPRPKVPGDPVAGGSLNGEQPLFVRVTRHPDASAAARIERLMRRAARMRPQFSQLADRVATGFVAVVLAIAALTALYWAMHDPANLVPNLVAVLIVTCPCALALATPVAATLAASRLASLGVLPMDTDKIEVLAAARVLACDKTGTLTEGRPHARLVRLAHPGPGFDPVAVAAALESNSAHPLARAFRDRGARVPQAEEVAHHPGCGVSGRVLGRRWRLGMPEFVLEHPPDAALEARIEGERASGRTVLLLAPEGAAPVALFALEDPPRPGLVHCLAEMRRSGIRHLALLSGDHPAAVERFAAGLGFDEVLGGLRPRDKLRWIHEVQRRGQRVLMLGDGINDTPVLAAADGSVSFASATEAARARSDFVLLGEDLRALAAARRLARRTLRIIRQNLAWAAGYNLAAVPLAAAGLVPPWLAAIGMSASSLLVVANALRLRERQGKGAGSGAAAGGVGTALESGATLRRAPSGVS